MKFLTRKHFHCVKSVHIRSYSGLYFLAFGLNTERYSVSLPIRYKYGKIRTRITPNTDTFYAVFNTSALQETLKHFSMGWGSRWISQNWFYDYLYKLCLYFVRLLNKSVKVKLFIIIWISYLRYTWYLIFW